jgi:hypothetical protein
MVNGSTTNRVVKNRVDGLVTSTPPRQNLGARPTITDSS